MDIWSVVSTGARKVNWFFLNAALVMSTART
jgi:hypothetical protein